MVGGERRTKISVHCPHHEDMKPGDKTMCELHVCSLSEHCPYYKSTEYLKDAAGPKSGRGVQLIFCQGTNGRIHRLIYFEAGGNYECPLCDARRWYDAGSRVQSKMRDRLRDKICDLRKEISNLSLAEKVRRENANEYIYSVVVEKISLREKLLKERTRVSVLETLVEKLAKDLNDVVERHTNR